MTLDRRRFLTALAAIPGLGALSRLIPAEDTGDEEEPARPRVRVRERSSVDPWVEVDGGALRDNARTVGEMAGGRPVWAVIKNGGYGHGLVEAGRALEAADAVEGLCVVKADEAVQLREAGVDAPVLHMGTAAVETARELARREVQLSAYRPDDPERLARIATELGRPVSVHVYLDTGMSRMGIPSSEAGPWLERLAAAEGVEIRGSYTALTEIDEVDSLQLERFRDYADDARGRGVDPGALHAASTYPLFHHMPAAGFDLVRPGLACYGACPAGADRGRTDLTPALRLRARVVRTERLEPGDGVSYGRHYVADGETWVATVPTGHADGYPREAVEGCRVLIGDRTYPVVGAVSASHTIVEVGPRERVEVGDLATLVGPDHPDVHPNAVADAAGVSVYDVLMHLGQGLPRRANGRRTR